MNFLRLHIAGAILLAAGAGNALAQSPGPNPAPFPPVMVPAPGGEIAITSPGDRGAYDNWHYAPARRAGDYVYISGIVIGRRPNEPQTAEKFKEWTRFGFKRLEALLKAYGLTFGDVVMINSFHDWSAPEFKGDRLAQFDAFRAVKDEFMTAPHPAWTAVGTSGLIREAGIVEVQMIAYAPKHRKSK